MDHYILTIYREDDTTPWFEVGTHPTHPAPYLHEPGEVDAGEVDFLEGRATIGQVNLRVIDPQTGASQAERWLTERLGIPAGEQGEGHTALIGRRALLLRDGAVVLDGVVYSVTLSESFAGFSLQLRDIRERERRAKLFTRTGTATVLPRGVFAGYGRLPSGKWLIPPTTPLRATWRTVGSFFDFSALWIKGNGRGGDGIVPAQLAITEAMTRALRQVVEPGEPYEEEYAPGQFRTVYPYRVHYPDVQVLWRPVGTTPWRVIDRPEGGPMQSGALVLKGPATVQATQGSPAADVSAAWGICVSPNTPDLPSDGQAVEVLILYVGPPSEDYPLHIETTAGELLRAIYRGDYSDAPPGIRYDEAALLALTTPVRLRITEPVDDARRWIEEHVYRALGAAPALDPQGRVSPVRAALPDPDAVLPVIDDDSAQAIPGWEHRADSAVTVVRVTYPRDYRVPVEQDPTGERSAGDGIVSREVTIELRAPDWAIGLMGEQVHEIDGSIFRALGGPDGEPVTGDVTDETGAQIALQRAHETIDRWLFGGQVSSCRIKAADFPGLRVGDWVIDARSWRPNYRTRQRGGSTLAQIMAIRAADPAWLDVMLVDAGPAEQPVQPPTLGTLSVNAEGVVSVPVTSVPAGGEAAVYYAISSTEPDPTSGLWTFLGRLGATGVLETPLLPAGARVWVRARGEALGRRPSAYTAAVSVTVPQTPRLQNVRVTVEAGTASVTWDRNAYAAGVRVRYEIHDPATDPTLGSSIDVDASLGTAQIPGTVHHGQAVTVELEPWTGWTGSAVSGTAGPRVRAAAAFGEAVTLYAECRVRIVASDATTVTVEVEAHPPHGTVYLLSLVQATRISGPALGVPAPSGTQWVFARPAFQAGEGQAAFRATAPGYESDDDHVVIPEVGRDTVPLTIRARVVSTTATTITVRVAVGDPVDPQRTGDATVSWQQVGTGGVSPASPQTIPAANIRTTPDASESAGGYRDFTITRPAPGAGAGRVVFTAARADRVQDLDAVDVPEQTPTVYRSTECLARIVSSTATQVTVQVTATAEGGGTPQVELVGVTGATLASGASPGTKVASGSTWTFNRPAFQAGAGQAQFRATLAGATSDDDLVVIPEQGRDTVGLVMRASVQQVTATQITVRVAVADPQPGAGNVTIAYVATGGTGLAVTPGSPQTIPAGSVTSDLATTGYVEFTITRPVAGSGGGRVTFTASRSGRVSDVDAVDVPELPPDVPVRSTPPTATLGSVGIDQGVASIELIGRPGIAGPVPHEYRYRTWAGAQIPPAFSGWMALDTNSGTYGWALVQVSQDHRDTRYVEAQVRDPNGRESAVAQAQVPPSGTISVWGDSITEFADADLDHIGDTATYRRTTRDEADGGGRAFQVIDQNLRVQSQVHLPMIAVGSLGSIQIPTFDWQSILTAEDMGSSVRISVSSHTLRIGGQTIPYFGAFGAATGLAYETRYYVYTDDPHYEGGTRVYVATTNPADVFDAVGRYYVGTIVTPKQGNPSTGGGGGGGGGILPPPITP